MFQDRLFLAAPAGEVFEQLIPLSQQRISKNCRVFRPTLTIIGSYKDFLQTVTFTFFVDPLSDGTSKVTFIVRTGGAYPKILAEETLEVVQVIKDGLLKFFPLRGVPTIPVLNESV